MGATGGDGGNRGCAMFRLAKSGMLEVCPCCRFVGHTYVAVRHMTHWSCAGVWPAHKQPHISGLWALNIVNQ